MDEYLTLFAALLGAATGGIIGLASAYLLQRQRFKRENVIEMRDKIYGPIFMEISEILEVTKLFKYHDYSSVENLKQVMNDYLFFTIKQDLKSKLSALIERLETYRSIQYAAEMIFRDITIEEVKKAFKVDIGSDANQIFLRSLIGATMASAISFKEAVFLKLAPKDFVRKEKEKWGEDIQIEVRIGGQSISSDDFESLYGLVLGKMEKESLYLEEKRQRMRLIQELEHFLEQIKDFVNLQ
jgi:hypothetical protein